MTEIVDGKDRLFKNRKYFVNKIWYKTHQLNLLIYFLVAVYSTALSSLISASDSKKHVLRCDLVHTFT